MLGGYRNANAKPEGDLPLVSIITVVKNGEKHLQQAMDSVFNQGYRNIEYIIVDGLSEDKTLELIRENESKIALWISEKDAGIFDAMNKGIAESRGEFIGILNSDDYYDERTITSVVEAFKISGADIIYGNMGIVSAGGGSLSIQKPDLGLMDQKPSVFHPACFVRSSVYRRIGKFDTDFKISSDYEFLLRCIRKKMKFYYLNETLTFFRTGGMSAKCASNIEGYRIMKMHDTGYHRQVIWRGIKCYAKYYIKKILNLAGKR